MNNELLGWIPFKFIRSGDEQLIQWLYTGDQPYTDPFFDETISKCRCLPQNLQKQKVVTSADWLIDVAENVNAVAPSAFVFHVSRCGSTLVSQLLGQLPYNIVLAEAPFLDAVLQNNSDEHTTKKLLHSVLAFYARKRNGNETHLFIKTDSWHLHFIHQLRSFFPGVPFFILYREPAAVLQSHLKRKGMQAVPGLLNPSIFGLEKELTHSLHPDRYMEKVLAGYYQQILKYADSEDIHIMCYEQGILNIVEKICHHAGVEINGPEQISLQQRIKYHSKDREQPFNGDVFTGNIIIDHSLEEMYNEIGNKRMSVSK